MTWLEYMVKKPVMPFRSFAAGLLVAVLWMPQVRESDSIVLLHRYKANELFSDKEFIQKLEHRVNVMEQALLMKGIDLEDPKTVYTSELTE